MASNETDLRERIHELHSQQGHLEITGVFII
jgi:hypothetical protein